MPQTFLRDILAFGPNDIWVCGEEYTGALFMHWNGNSWSIADSPIEHNTSVNAISGHAPDDIWAATHFESLLIHYDGNSWSVTDTVQVNSYGNIANEMSFASDGIGWGAGAYSIGDVSYPLAMRLTPELPPIEDLTISARADSIYLRWSPSLGAELYGVYGDITSDFIPSPATLLISTPATFTMLPVSDPVFFYSVIAVSTSP